MVIESFITPMKAEQRPWQMILLGIFYSTVAIMLGYDFGYLLGAPLGLSSSSGHDSAGDVAFLIHKIQKAFLFLNSKR